MALALGLFSEVFAHTARVLGLFNGTRTIAIVGGYDCAELRIDFNYHVLLLYHLLQIIAPPIGTVIIISNAHHPVVKYASTNGAKAIAKAPTTRNAT
jgi:hypothetical protein